ncbi:MAG: uracil-DNA glycosylase family protein [Candidatus Parvarchaeum sp.]
MKLEDMEEYLGLKAGIRCQACPYNLTATKQILGQKTGLGLKVLIVGEAPGKEEDETGVPFIGKSGQLLRELISPILPYSYITNMIKCRPPENKLQDEKWTDVCVHKHLIFQIAEMYPPVALLVGKTAERYFPYEIYDGRVFKIAHPAWVLYKPSLKNEYMEEVRKVVRDIQTFLYPQVI